MQFHPLAYMVKLKIEMSMAELIGKVARKRDMGILSAADFTADRNSFHPSEYSVQLPSYARGRVDYQHNNVNPIELNNVGNPIRGINVAAVSSGPCSRRESVSAATSAGEDGQPKMAIYRTREVVVEIERIPQNPEATSSSHTTVDDVFDISLDDDSSTKGLQGLQALPKSLALPDIQAPWAGGFSTRIWDGTNCEQDPTLPTSVAKIGSGWQKNA